MGQTSAQLTALYLQIFHFIPLFTLLDFYQMFEPYIDFSWYFEYSLK